VGRQPTVPVNVLINLLTTLNTFGTIIVGKYNVDRGYSHDLSTPNCFLQEKCGSCTLCVVAEGALCGRIEVSKNPLLPIESYDHVSIHPFFSAC